MRGQAVRYAQYLLRARGEMIPVTGVFDARTLHAVRSFQRRYQLKVDGVLGESSWPLLVMKVRRGERSDAVRALQMALRDNGVKVTVDGFYGAATEKALRAAQHRYGLTENGVAGDLLWYHLISGTLPHPSA